MDVKIGLEFAAGLPIVVALVAFLRKGLPPLHDRAWPWLTLAVAMLVALLAWAAGALVGTFWQVLVTGLILGLTAAGFYDALAYRAVPVSVREKSSGPIDESFVQALRGADDPANGRPSG